MTLSQAALRSGDAASGRYGINCATGSPCLVMMTVSPATALPSISAKRWLASVAFTVIDICWQLIFASLPVLVVTQYHANPHILGWLFGAFGGGALIGAFASMPIVRRVEALTLGATAFCFEMGSLWILAVPAPWEIAFAGMALAGLVASIVNAPIQSLITLRIPREVRTQGMAAFAVFQCLGSPAGLVAAGWALGRYDTRSVLAVVLLLDTIAAATFVAATLVERTALRAAASLDSPA